VSASAVVAVALGLIALLVWLVLGGLTPPTVWTDGNTPIVLALFAAFVAAAILHVALWRRAGRTSKTPLSPA
jgi:Na+(H+)/acetate symporter ActP